MMKTPVVTFVLSQYMGIYMLIMAVIMSNRVTVYRRMIKETDPHSGTILLGATVGLLTGLFLVGINNLWILNPILFITVLSWMILIFSILWLCIPEHMLKLTTKTFVGRGYYVVVALLGGWGIIFLMRGIYIYVTHRNVFVFLDTLVHMYK